MTRLLATPEMEIRKVGDFDARLSGAVVRACRLRGEAGYGQGGLDEGCGEGATRWWGGGRWQGGEVVG